MKKYGILHKDLCALIGEVGHGDVIVVCDAGFAVPKGAHRVELAIEKNVPAITRVLELLREELIIERYALAKEIQDVNPVTLQKYREIYAGMKVREVFVDHEELANGIAPKAKAVVRCGSFQPYGSIAIYPAINAAEWYEAEGTVVPDLYKDRV